MGLLSDHLYALVGDRLVSIHAQTTLALSPGLSPSVKGGDTVYELRVDGDLADSHRHGTLPKGGSMFAVLDRDGKKTSVRVDVSPGIFGTKYKLLVDDADTPLTKSSEAEITALWHEKSLLAASRSTRALGVMSPVTREEPWPYNLPIFRRAFRATTPDGQLQAEVSQADEVSMSNPTIGVLKMSGGLVLKDCNPSFVWSDDSRYLAVPQLSRLLGCFFAVRVLVVDTRARTVFASRRFRAWLQPQSFVSGRLVVCVNPGGSSREARWDIPSDLESFKRLTYEEAMGRPH